MFNESFHVTKIVKKCVVAKEVLVFLKCVKLSRRFSKENVRLNTFIKKEVTTFITREAD